jgi:hypothetical protein
VTAQPTFFPLTGGLDQETPALTMPPGRVIACLNHEMASQGVRRTDGYERFDGRPAPSEARFYLIPFTNGAVAFVPGTQITGQSSGGKFTVLDVAVVTSGSFGGGNAVGYVPATNLIGALVGTENLRIGVTTYAKKGGTVEEADRFASAANEALYLAMVEARRTAIGPVPGSGPVRGVLWYDGKLRAWRDNAGATAGVLHYSDELGGWSPQPLHLLFTFTDGGPYEFQVNDLIEGQTSGAQAVLQSIVVNSGDWATSDAAGVMVAYMFGAGAFVAGEQLKVGINTDNAELVAVPSAITFPPGGRYEFDIFNFYGSVGFERAYGVNGVGPAFEFDGDFVIPISTGMPDDKPFLVQAHKYHLFLGFPKGSLQHSDLGEPRSWTARLGASELGMGHELTSIIPSTSSALLVTTETTLAALTGNDSSDWVLQGLSDEAGAKRFTQQRIGNVIYLDNRGIRSVESTSAYGNFKIGTYTAAINPTLDAKRREGVIPVASCIVKSKDQYLLFFSDGTGVSLFFGRKKPEPMLFEYPFVVSCIEVREVDGVERIWVGATDGYVYELNVGTSFDGADIEAFIALPFGHQGDPRSLKRYHKSIIEMVAGPHVELGVLPQFDYGNDYQPFVQELGTEIEAGDNSWNLGGNFVWSAPAQSQVEVYLQGVGANMSLLIKSISTLMDSYVLQGVTIMYSVRGRKR